MREQYYRVRCPNLKDHFRYFKVQLAEYTAAGRNSALNYAFFDQIRDEKCRIFKMLFKGNSLTKALEDLADHSKRHCAHRNKNLGYK